MTGSKREQVKLEFISGLRMNGVTDLRNERENHTIFKRQSDMCKALVMRLGGI